MPGVRAVGSATAGSHCHLLGWPPVNGVRLRATRLHEGLVYPYCVRHDNACIWVQMHGDDYIGGNPIGLGGWILKAKNHNRVPAMAAQASVETSEPSGSGGQRHRVFAEERLWPL